MCSFVMSATLLIASGLSAAPDRASTTDPVESLEAKIEAGLKGTKWSPQTTALVRQLWTEYKRAHNDGATIYASYSAAPGQERDADDYDGYVGAYQMSVDGPAVMEVTKNERGRFFVKMDSHVIPAVPAAQAILITTGDVIQAPSLPHFVRPKHASLEYFEIVQVDGEIYFSSPGIGDVKGHGRRLHKLTLSNGD
jgi:hypothetical protein